MSASRNLAVCIVSLERARLTERCIQSVQATTAAPYRIFVVDNGSTRADTQELLKRLEDDPSISLERLDSNRGPAYARNRVIGDSLGEFAAYAMFDNDMIALPGWADAAWRAIDRGVAMVQPKLLKPDLQTIERGPMVAWDAAFVANPRYIGIGLDRYAPEVSSPMPVPVAGAGVYSRTLFDRVGLYDERLFVAEDFDLSYRAAAAGLRIEYEPACELVHDHEFDLAYDEVRTNVERILEANDILIAKHRKVLLSPEYLSWYSWLLDKGEPTFLNRSAGRVSFLRRLKRRAAKEWFRRVRGNHWKSLDQALRETTRRRAASGARNGRNVA